MKKRDMQAINAIPSAERKKDNEKKNARSTDASTYY